MILFYSILAFFVGFGFYFVYRSKPESRPMNLLWAYSIISAASVGVYPYLNVVGHGHAMMALCLLVAIPLFLIIFMTAEKKDSATKLLASLMYLNAGITFYNGWGLANAGSFDAALFMAAMPIFFHVEIFKSKWSGVFHVAFAALFMLWTQSNTAAMILTAYGLFYLFKSRFKGLVIGSAIILVSAISYLGKGGASGHARYEGWKHYIGIWYKDANHYVGTGIGTFQGMAPLMPEVATTKEIYLYMHNDYVQMLFEGGLIGLSLLLFCVGYLFLKATQIRLKAAVLGFAVCMLTYSPLHIIIGQLSIGILVLSIIYERNENAIKRN